jgi:hypothetical protein
VRAKKVTGTFLSFLALAFVFLANAEDTDTDLGEAGNRAVARRFAEYLEKGSGCEPVDGSLPRVMLAGFGLFSGVPFNISGAVIDHLQGDGTFREDARGILTDADRGARVVSRVLNLPSGPVDACLLILDVQWDLAASILIHEIRRFEPLSVIMSGRGSFGAIVESGAQNRAVFAPGFNPDGSMNEDNRPVAPPILMGESETAPMLWDQAYLGERIRSRVEAAGHDLVLPASFRPSNEYICNNISYAVLKALEGRPISLAGGLVNFEPQTSAVLSAGFFHYPARIEFSRDSIEAWSAILLEIADASLSRRL